MQDEYISLTDIAKYKNPQDAKEFIMTILNPSMGLEKKQVLQKWVETTNAIGLVSVEFKLYLIKDNYRIHTDAIKENSSSD